MLKGVRFGFLVWLVGVTIQCCLVFWLVIFVVLDVVLHECRDQFLRLEPACVHACVRIYAHVRAGVGAGGQAGISACLFV